MFAVEDDVVHALDNVDLRVGEGEFVSIVGPSGCGKSTLLRLVAGLRESTVGDVEFRGHRVTKPQTEVGIVFQNDALLDWLSVLDNVLLQVDMRGERTPELIDHAKALLSMVGLRDFENRRPYELSGGMRQRVSICRALVHKPPVMLMDEPFGALDALTREQMMSEMQAIWMNSGMSVLFITHSIQEAVYLSDRVLVMSARPGRIIAELESPFPRPRPLSLLADPEFNRLAEQIRGLLI